MLKNDFDRARYDDSIQMIVLKLIFVRRMRRGQHTIAATRTHVVTTLNALETTGSTRARKARRDDPMESISPFTELASSRPHHPRRIAARRPRRFFFSVKEFVTAFLARLWGGGGAV